MYYYVELVETGEEKMTTLKLVRELSGLGLAEAKDLVENPPFTVVGGLTEENANEVCKVLEAMGNKAFIAKDFYASNENMILGKVNIYKYSGLRSDSQPKQEVQSKESAPFSATKVTPSTVSNSTPSTVSSSTPSQAWNSASPIVNSSTPSPTRNSTPSTPRKPVPASNKNSTLPKVIPDDVPANQPDRKVFLIVGGLLAGFFLFAIMISVSIFAGISSITKNTGNNNDKLPSQITSAVAANAQIAQAESKYILPDMLTQMSEQVIWQSFAEDAFGKEVSELTNKDFHRVTYIDYNKEEYYGAFLFTYQLDDGITHRIAVPEEKLELSFLALFPNLEYLDSDMLHCGNNTKVTLPSLKHLGYRSSGFTDELGNSLTAERVTSLRLKSFHGSSSYTRYPDLEELTLDSDQTPNFESLSELSNLKSLTISSNIGGDFDVNSLVKLTGLESLRIGGHAIKDIRFIEKLPNLHCFGLSQSSVINLAPIEHIADQLTELHLFRNNQATGYGFIADMTQLKTLELVGWLKDDTEFPNLSKLTGLEELIVGQTHDLSSLSSLTNLKRLVLEDPYDSNLSYLANMPQLTELHLHDGSIHEESLSCITSLPHVEYLCLNDTFMWCDISEVFQMPTVTYLNLYYADGGLMPERVKENNTLTYLNMDHFKFHTLTEEGKWFYDNELSDLSKVSSFLSNMKALHDLYIPNYRIEDVEFLSENKNLHFLDISDTYVVDLTPLKNLPLRFLHCRGTQILDDAGLTDVMNAK